MAKCKNCGKHVSRRFEKVLSNNEGDLWACPNCSAQTGIVEVSKERSV